MSEEGVTFKSHLDGSRHLLTPERSMAVQRALGSDVVMAFDECTPFPATPERAAASMERSMRWARRSREGFDSGEAPAVGEALLGIQQGSPVEEMRRISYDKRNDNSFPG